MFGWHLLRNQTTLFITLVDERDGFESYAISVVHIKDTMCWHHCVLMGRLVSHRVHQSDMHCTTPLYWSVHHATGSWVNVIVPGYIYSTNTATDLHNSISALIPCSVQVVKSAKSCTPVHHYTWWMDKDAIQSISSSGEVCKKMGQYCVSYLT